MPSFNRAVFGLVLGTALLSGCGTAAISPSLGAANAASHLSAKTNYIGSLTRTLQTGVGSVVTVTLQGGDRQEDSGLYLDPVNVTVTYADLHNYFHGAAQIAAYVHTDVVDHVEDGYVGAGRPVERQALPMMLQGTYYVGGFPFDLSGAAGDSGETLSTMQLAFNGNGLWDSNNGQNYTVDLGGFGQYN